METNAGTALRALIKRNKDTIIRFSCPVIVIVVFGVLTGGRLFSGYNIRALIGQTAPLLIAGVGVIYMFSNGSIDISSGAVAGLCAMISALILNAAGSLALAIMSSVIISAALYLFGVVVSIKFRLLSTIASLAIMFMARGVVAYVCSLTPGAIIRLDNFGMINRFRSDSGLQLAVISTTALVCWILYSFTKIGKHAKAIGDNPASAEQSGAQVNKNKIICALISGVCVGIASIFLLSRSGSVSQNIGSGMEMDIMVALILGGMSLSGGSKSRFGAAVLGPITLRLLSNGMTMSGVPTEYVSLIRGIIFLLIIFATLRQSKNIKEMPR